MAAVCQHLAHSLARRHAAGGVQIPLQRPLFGGTGEHRDRRATGEHAGRHMALGSNKLQPEYTKETNMIKQKRQEEYGEFRSAGFNLENLYLRFCLDKYKT